MAYHLYAIARNKAVPYILITAWYKRDIVTICYVLYYFTFTIVYVISMK